MKGQNLMASSVSLIAHTQMLSSDYPEVANVTHLASAGTQRHSLKKDRLELGQN